MGSAFPRKFSFTETVSALAVRSLFIARTTRTWKSGLKLLVAMGPSTLPRLQEISLNPLVLMFALAASLTSSLLFGLIPAIKYTSPAGMNLGGAARGASASRERNRSRNFLVVVQVALALVLLVSSGLMMRSLQALQNVNTGFTEAKQIQTARIWFPAFLVREPERYTRMECLHSYSVSIAWIASRTLQSSACF
jgi:putative ABC transport system permease protein